ncbi:50S ribosomal protein L25 [Candidatus Kaiserbacteria bacterium]|nr:50S ribosomal protein L25 [Candidatus Kaiserbacteria bacterium]
MISLPVTKRDGKQTADALRKSGVMPAVFYGPKETSTAITIPLPAFERLWRESGETTIITLTGVGEPKEVLIQDVAEHPVTGTPLHADFYVLEKGKKIEIAVPIEFEGIAPAEKEGGVVVKVLHEIEIKVTPAELPQHLTVDVSKLEKIGDHITVAQVKLPLSAELITDPEELVVSITEQKIVEEEETKPPTDEELAAQAAAATPAEGEEGGAAAEKKEKKE